jgi:hypothetical protein
LYDIRLTQIFFRLLHFCIAVRILCILLYYQYFMCFVPFGGVGVPSVNEVSCYNALFRLEGESAVVSPLLLDGTLALW